MSKLTLLTAWTSPSGVRKRTSRFLTERTGTDIRRYRSLGSRASRKPSPMKLKQNSVSAMNRAGKIERPGRGFDLARAFGDQHAPRCERLADAEAEERQEALRQDHARNRQRDIDDHRPHHVGHDVAADDAERPDTRRARRFDELLLFRRQRLPAHDPRHGQPRDRADRDEQQHEVLVEDRPSG